MHTLFSIGGMFGSYVSIISSKGMPSSSIWASSLSFEDMLARAFVSSGVRMQRVRIFGLSSGFVISSVLFLVTAHACRLHRCVSA